jgi:hypothetical protein
LLAKNGGTNGSVKTSPTTTRRKIDVSTKKENEEIKENKERKKNAPKLCRTSYSISQSLISSNYFFQKKNK